MGSVAALALPARFQQVLGRTVASHYVTYAAQLPYHQPWEYLCVRLLQPCPYGLAFDTDMASW